jgi:hypothetical protein
MMSCADATPAIMHAVIITKADFDIRALLSNRKTLTRQRLIVLCDGSCFLLSFFERRLQGRFPPPDIPGVA